MYQLLLTRKYLTSKVMPLLAALAVMLCVATQIIVLSVMGGWLEMLKESGRELSGDVAIAWPVAGFPHYAELIDLLESDPAIAAATPVIETFGMISLPNDRTEQVVIKGVDAATFADVTEYRDTLWWRPVERPLPADHDRRDPRLTDPPGSEGLWARKLEDGLRLWEPGPAGDRVPAVVPGIAMSGLNAREPGGYFEPRVTSRRLPDGTIVDVNIFLPNTSVRLYVVPLDAGRRAVELASREFPVANEFRTGLYQVDERTVLADLSAVQAMLRMNEARRLAPEGVPGAFAVEIGPDGQERFSRPAAELVDPARVTTVLVRAAPGVTLAEAASACRVAYAAFADRRHGDVPDPSFISIATWLEQNSFIIAAVEKEIVLVMFIFGVISVTAVFLVLAIFWSIVSEKTKDVGVLRSLGATRSGIACLWLGYGLSIGLAGAALGGAAAWAIVVNINPIHEWLGSAMGVQVWDPRIYYFAMIPNHVDPVEAATIMGVGVLASVAGALWPAVRAGTMHPVRALRFE